MTPTMFVVPLDGKEVPDPERGGYLPGKGADVPKTPYWLRRRDDKDVAVITPETETAEAVSVDPPKKEKK